MKRWTRKLLAGLLSFGMLLQVASPLSALAAEGGTQGGTLSILCAGELLATMNREADGTLSWENAYNPFEGVQIEYDATSKTYKFEGMLTPPKNGYMTMKTDSTEDSIYIDGGAQNAVNGTVYIGTNESPVKNVIITSSNSEATVKEMAVIRATGDVELLNTGGGKVAEQAVSYCKAQSVSIVGGSSNVPTADVYIWVEDAFGDVNIANNAEDGLIAGGRVRVKADGNVGIKGGIAKTSRNTTESTVISGSKVTFDANASSANALKDMSLTVTAGDAVTLKSHSSNSFLSGEKAYIDVTAPSLTVGNDGSGVIDGTVKFTRTNTTDDYRVAVGESESSNTQAALTGMTYSETVNAKYLNIQPGTPENTDPDDQVTNYGITVTIGNNPPIEVTSENCGKILGDGNDKLTYNPNTYTLTGKGSFGKMKVEITSDDQVDVVLSNANGTVVNGNLTVTGAQDVEVTGVSSTALITEDATITCDGDILMENTGTGNVIGTHDGTDLAVNKASSVTIKNMGTEGNRSYAIYGRADITCSGNVEIVSSNGMAIWDPIVVTGAEDVKIKAAGRAIWDGRGDPDTIMTKIECSGKVEITSDTAAALHEGNLIIKGATDVAISGKHRFYHRDFLGIQSHILTHFHHLKRFIGSFLLQSHLRRNHIIAISQETDGKGNQGEKHQRCYTIQKRTIADSSYHRQNHNTHQSVSGIGIPIERKQVFRGVFFDNLSMITHLNNRGINAIYVGSSKKCKHHIKPFAHMHPSRSFIVSEKETDQYQCITHASHQGKLFPPAPIAN